MSDRQDADKVDPRSADIAESRRRELVRLFPEVRTEDGKIDFDCLRQALGDSVDVGRERYGMTWPGKADCFKAIQAPSLATLRPCREESVNFDTAENLIIEGDNLEVLKLLQKSYLGKVKMIYIDPPYNTGNDFIYPDNYGESLQTYLQYTGQVDAEGRKFGTNPETGGRFHSKWLNMMYPRLYLARNLLRDEGIIFASIDDREVVSLRVLLNEIFGEECFVATFVWKRKAGGGDDSGYVAAEHEYILCYARDPERASLGAIEHESPAMTAKYRRSENGRRYYLERLDKTSLTYNSSMDFAIECPDGTSIRPPQPDPSNPTTIWRWGRRAAVERRDELVFDRDRKTSEWRVYTKTWESLQGVTPRSLLVDKEHGRNRDGTRELSELIGPKIFNNPKPTKLIRHLLNMGAKEKDSIVLDFFAGSGTTGQSVLDQNQEDGGRRAFILVQLPEPTGRDDYPTITKIVKERVRRVVETAATGSLPLDTGHNIGFRSLQLAASNFRLWNADAASDPTQLETQLELHIRRIRPDRTPEDLMFEILLKEGYAPTTRVASTSVSGKDIFSAADGRFLVCLDRALTLDVIRAMADGSPQRVVCLDEGFAGNDQLKANAVQIFKSKGIVFRTI